MTAEKKTAIHLMLHNLYFVGWMVSPVNLLLPSGHHHDQGTKQSVYWFIRSFIYSFIYSSIHSFIHLSISQVDEPDWLMALISTVRLWRLSSEKSSCSSPSCINNRIKERLTYHGGDRHGIERHGNSMMEFQPVIQESHVVSTTHCHTQQSADKTQ